MPAAASLMEPFDVMDAGRMAVFADPEGAAFCVWQAKEHKGARIVNEHGSLNFNGLNTRDAEGAKSFYGSVFGWETLGLRRRRDVDAAGLRRLPRAERPRAPQADGRESALRRASRTSSRRSTRSPTTSPMSPPHWSVTFAVDDADATAAKAAELGGQVVVPPFDAPWVRMTVITDPQGATFIASKFVPENKDLGTQVDSTATAA